MISQQRVLMSLSLSRPRLAGMPPLAGGSSQLARAGSHPCSREFAALRMHRSLLLCIRIEVAEGMVQPCSRVQKFSVPVELARNDGSPRGADRIDMETNALPAQSS